MKRFFSLKLAWSLLLIHLIFAAVVVAQLPTYDEVGCDEAVVFSSLDGSVAGRMFYYNYSSSVEAGLMQVDLPAIIVASSVTHMVPGAYDYWTGANLSWIRAGLLLLTTSFQWFAFGLIGTLVGRCVMPNRRPLTSAPNKPLDASGGSVFRN